MKVRRKLETIVLTPTFVAIASMSAISAIDSPGTCERVSAQNHCGIALWLKVSARAKQRSNVQGSRKAAPIKRHPSNRKPWTRLPASMLSNTATPKRAMPKSAKIVIILRDACAQACGVPASIKGKRARRINVPMLAINVPPTAMPRPETHQDARI